VTTTTEEQTLAEVTEDGAPVRRRLATPKAVHTVAKKMDEVDSDDAYRRAIIEGMINGNPPYDQTMLDDAGLGTVTNTNFMALSANLNARVSAAHELLAEVSTLVEISPSVPDPEDKTLRARTAVIQEEFSRMVTDWTGFLPMIDTVIREADAYGIGPAMFRDSFDWRVRAFKRGNLRFEPRAKVVVDSNTLLQVRDEFDAGYFFDLLENEEAARTAGWKVASVKDLLVRVYYKKETAGKDQNDPYLTSTWESLQQARKNNDPTVQAKEFDRIPVRHTLVTEGTKGRRVTHLILTENNTYEYFLFEKVGRFNKMSSVVWWLPANYADGYVASIRGVASWMAKHDDLSNRFLCKTFDAGFLTAGMVLQADSATDLSRLQFIQHGPWTIIPPETKAVQPSFMPKVGELLQLRGVSESIMQNNTGTNRRYDEDPDSNSDRKTARQVVEESSKEQRYEKAEIAFRYQHFDALYTEMFRRATDKDYVNSKIDLPGLDEVRKFLERCRKRGVKKSQIVGKADNYVVAAARAIGLGSLGVKYDLTNQILNARAMLDAEGQQNALRDWVAVRVGWRNVDRFVQPVSRDMIPSNEMSHAVLENNDLVQGQAVQVGSDQLHKVHIKVVMEGIIVPLLKASSEEKLADPVGAFKTLAVAIPHAQAHLQYVAQDKEAQAEYVKSIQGILEQAVALFKKLQGVVEQMQAEQQRKEQEQQQTVEAAEQTLRDRDMEAKIYEIQKKYEAEMLKQESLNAARQQKTEEQMDILRDKMERDSARRDAEAAANIRRKDAEAEAEAVRK